MKRKRTLWIAAGLLVLLVLLIALGRSSGESGERVATEKAALHTITEMVTGSGKIYPEQEVKISPEVSGEVIELTVKEGDSVQAGQLLARINPATYSSMVSQAEASVQQSQAQVLNGRETARQARAQLEQARSAYQRSQKLHREKVISTQEFEQAEAAYKSAAAAYDASQAAISGGRYGVQGASASLAQARANLRKTVLTAPVSGTVASLLVKQGERVVGTAQMAGTEMMTIANLGRMEVRVDISETEIAKVKVGDTALVTADAYRNRPFTGVVSSVSVSSKASSPVAAATEQVTNYTVKILLLPEASLPGSGAERPAPPVAFKPGMTASVDIITRRERETLSVPVNAVTTRPYPDSILQRLPPSARNKPREVVFVVDEKNKTVSVREVRTGIQDNNFLQILSGLKAGEWVVIAPYSAIARTLKDAARVRIVPKEQLFGGGQEADKQEN